MEDRGTTALLSAQAAMLTTEPGSSRKNGTPVKGPHIYMFLFIYLYFFLQRAYPLLSRSVFPPAADAAAEQGRMRKSALQESFDV